MGGVILGSRKGAKARSKAKPSRRAAPSDPDLTGKARPHPSHGTFAPSRLRVNP
jgi:hypothetical protein